MEIETINHLKVMEEVGGNSCDGCGKELDLETEDAKIETVNLINYYCVDCQLEIEDYLTNTLTEKKEENKIQKQIKESVKEPNHSQNTEELRAGVEKDKKPMSKVTFRDKELSCGDGRADSLTSPSDTIHNAKEPKTEVRNDE